MNPNAPIYFTCADCPLGRLLLAGTERGLCAVYLGDNDAQLESELKTEFRTNVVERDDDRLAAWRTILVNHLNGQETQLDLLPLDIRATSFQRRVWQQLQAIPYGSTRSYRAIARALGRPSAVRAVGRACASNPVSLVIPCHRVVREDGGLGGYRWGLERKQALLAQEKEKVRQT